MKTVVKPRAVQHLNFDGADDHRKPSKSYVEMVVEVLRDSYSGEMHPSEIYHALEVKYSYYRNMSPRSKKSWMSSIRHALLHPAFKSRPGDTASNKRGKVWSLNENFDEDQRDRRAKSPPGQMHSRKRKSAPLQEVPMPQAIQHDSQGLDSNQGSGNQPYTDYGLYAQQYARAAAYSQMLSPYAAAHTASAVSNLAPNTFVQRGNSPVTFGSYYGCQNGLTSVPVRSYVPPGPVQNAVRFLPPPGGMTVAPILSPPSVTSSFLSGGMLVSSRRSPVYGAPVSVVDPTAAARALCVVPHQNTASGVVQHEGTQENQNGPTQEMSDSPATQQQDRAYLSGDPRDTNPAVATTAAATPNPTTPAAATTEQQRDFLSRVQQVLATTPTSNGRSSGGQAVHSTTTTASQPLVQIHHYSPKDVQKQNLALPPAPENCACCVMYYTPPKKARTDMQYGKVQEQCDGPESQLLTEHSSDGTSPGGKDDLHQIIRKSLDISSNDGGGGWVNDWTSFMTSSMMGAMGQCVAKVESMDTTPAMES